MERSTHDNIGTTDGETGGVDKSPLDRCLFRAHSPSPAEGETVLGAALSSNRKASFSRHSLRNEPEDSFISLIHLANKNAL